MLTDEDTVDYAALDRMWPEKRYGSSWRFAWFNRVGRTRQQREGLKALRVHRGPRGIAELRSGHIRTRSTLSGEFEAQ